MSASPPRDRFLEKVPLFCRDVLDREPQTVERLGGKARTVARVGFDDGSTAIVCRRDQVSRAELEANVLRDLRRYGAPTPRLVARRDGWLMQEDLGHNRLSEHLVPSDRDTCRAWLERAAESLIRLQAAGSAAGLQNLVAPIGRREGWTENLVAAPDAVAGWTGLPVPDFDRQSVDLVLRSADRRFIKWDARPGNAIATRNGDLFWFDFEHCGCRDPLDDLAWLLCDEYVPDDPAFETELLPMVLPFLAPRRPAHAARRYLATFGVLHSCIRLNLIHGQKDALGDWLDEARCRRLDTIGCTPEAVIRVARRAARWADGEPALRSLTPWFLDIAAAVPGGSRGVVADRGLALRPAA